MDRVRSLLNNRIRHCNNGSAVRQSGSTRSLHANNVDLRTPVNNTDDDQKTVFESDILQTETLNDFNTANGSETETLNTYFSESCTIGDLQTHGYVNRSPQFTSVRNISFISILLTRGLFAFSSDLSYKQYLQNKRKFDLVDPSNGLGVPLFHAISLNLVESIFRNKNEPVMKIYKYEIVNSIDIDNFPNADTIYEGENFIIIKFLFCTIYRETMNVATVQSTSQQSMDQDLKIKHTLRFYNDKSTEMFNINNRRDIDTTLDTLPLRWFGFSSFASPFGSNDIKLLILDDNTPNLVNDSNIQYTPNNPNSNAIRPLGYLPIWAKYSDAGSSLSISMRRTISMANLEIKETSTNSNNLGIINIPWNTQELTCMCMLLHDYESRKERRHINSTSTINNRSLS